MGNLSIHGIISDKLSLSKDEFSVSNLNSAIAINFSVVRSSEKGSFFGKGHLHAINCENITLPPFGSAVNNI